MEWSWCCILTFIPGKHAIPKWCTERKWHIPMASNRKRSCGRIWLMKWDKVKFPWYAHRLMHRKRVTSELHDSYFRLMTIKRAIPKIEWAIEWALNYYITPSRQEVRQLGSREAAYKMWQRKPGGGGPWSSWWVRDRTELETRCGRESHTRPTGLGAPDWVGDQRRRRQDVVGKATPGLRGPQDPRWSLGTRPVGDKMQ